MAATAGTVGAAIAAPTPLPTATPPAQAPTDPGPADTQAPADPAGETVVASAAPNLGPLGGLVDLAVALTLGPASAQAEAPSVARVAMAQTRLRELGYRPGPIDGLPGAQTSSALLAFQKREGLPRTGVLDADTAARLPDPQGAGPRGDVRGARIEIDIARQVMFVVDADGSLTTLNTSTGNGEVYAHPAGGTAVANTPTGVFAIGYRINGPEVAPLGTLYRPMYFVGPFAIHGSSSVPAYPASHGCARTSNVDQDWLYERTPTGTTVYVY